MAEITLEELKAEHEKLITTLKDWKNESTKLAVDYNNAIQTIRDTITRLDATEKTWWNVYRSYIAGFGGLIVIIIIVFGLIASGHFCGTITFPFIGGSYTGRACTT
jgi:hypothetical protein